ncbi:C2H2 zinc finger [Ceratobasidium sp. AG-Ba]|nr:C2H2 zinc finger [Ceratobasidium sp. AG-Ba]
MGKNKNKNKKKNKFVLRPWCWYCEREFEDEKVLMQHQKAKHFKCNHCPRRLNTAGGLAVHIQQVHKLDPEKIENALPGRDGYEVEIFGMEGIPAPDMAAYKRRKEEELGLASGTISQPPAKRPKMDYRQPTDAELAAQLAAHKALMAGNDLPGPTGPSGPAVFGAPTAFAPPFPPPMGMIPPPFAPGGAPIHLGGPPPFPPPPGMMPPFPGGLPPPGAAISPPVPGAAIPPLPPGSALPLPPPGAATPGTTPAPTLPSGAPEVKVESGPKSTTAPTSNFVNPPMKEGTALVYNDANASPDEARALTPKYNVTADAPPDAAGNGGAENSRKRARAEDFL